MKIGVARWLAVAIVAVFALSSVGLVLLAAPVAPSGLTAPRASLPAFPGGGVAPAATIPVPATGPAASATPAHSSPAGVPQCPTPNNPPVWGGLNGQDSNFFDDVQVSFSIPGSPGLSRNFQELPCSNSIPTYTNGFWVNISTNVQIVEAYLDIFGYQWPSQSNPQPPIAGFPAANVTPTLMVVNGPLDHTASFFFNDYRFFWPGSQVFFNITVIANASPAKVYSGHTHGIPVYFPGGENNATWGFGVESPWAGADVFNPSSNLSKYIHITTIPSVLTNPAYAPNPHQKLQIILDSYNLSGGPSGPIPMAQMQLTLTGNETGVYNVSFGPANSSEMRLSTPIGPYPGTNVSFTVMAWLPWQTGAVDRIYSPVLHFNWTTNGGWWYPNLPLDQNLEFSTSPNLIGVSPPAVLPTGTAVNVSIHEPIQNVSIGSAEVHFHYSDGSGSSDGLVPMTAITQNSSYALLPGLPDSGHMTFYVVAKDIYGTPLGTGNLSYAESGPLANNASAGYGMFFFEAVDLATGKLVPFLSYSLANGTWSQSGVATPMGFGYPEPLAGTGYLAVTYGTYVITIHAFGETETATLVLTASQPLTPLVFYVTSGPVPSNSWVPPGSFPVIGLVGLAGSGVASWPLYEWFRERRKKAEAEQKRISL